MPQQNQETTTLRPTRQQKLRESILALAAGGMAVALSTVLSMIKLYAMPQGGAVTAASMLPIIFCALAFGPVWGVGIGAVYGLVQFIIEPYVVSWAQVILDYPLAFALLGLAGLFAASGQQRIQERNILYRLSMVPMWRMIIGIIIGIIGRLAASFTSGIVFYGMYAPEGQSAAVYSLVYNGTYLIPETVIILIVLIPLAAVFRRNRV